MTRPLNLSRPVKCAKCGQKFTRTHGREKLCAGCKRPDVRTRMALKSAAEKSAVESGSECRYPACGHKLASRIPDLIAGTCRLR